MHRSLAHLVARLAAAPALAFPLLAQTPDDGGSDPVGVAISDLVWREDAPGYPEVEWLDVAQGSEFRLLEDRVRPRVVVHGAEEAYLRFEAPQWAPRSTYLMALSSGRLVASGTLGADELDAADERLEPFGADHPASLRGWILLPPAEAEGDPVRLHFAAPPETVGRVEELVLARARADHFTRLVGHELPGAAWFRLRRQEAVGRARELAEEAGVEADLDEVTPRFGRRADATETYELFTGGRALAENLQLDRELPDRPGEPEEEEEAVAIDSLQGIATRAFDWTPLLEGVDPEVDPLARHLPADQHAFFAPSLAALAEVLDEVESGGAPVLALFEARSRHAGTRERTETQLCAPLDGLARTLGSVAAGSVAVTGSDPFLRTGTDLAVLVEARAPDLVVQWVRARQARAAASEGEDAELVRLDVGPWTLHGLVTPDRRRSSYVAAGDGFALLANSLVPVRALAEVAAEERAALASSEEYLFFRERYPRGTEGELGFALLPDAAIRRWCGPRWRIASSRRTRALAAVADLTARNARELLAGEVEPRPLEDTYDVDLGGVRLEPGGVRSATYGTLRFQTPIAELDLDEVTAREASLYGLWRDGYERNWSRYFDPVGAHLVRTGGRLSLDLFVLPLIAGSEYRDLLELVGDERLEGRDGDPHPGTLAHYVGALDPASRAVREIGSMLSVFSRGELDGLSWLGDWYSVHLDESPFVDRLLEAESYDEASEMIRVDLDELPLVFEVGVSSPMRLAAFLTSLRAFAETSVPGLVEWRTEATDDGRKYVHIASPDLDDVSIFYATTSKALLVSFERDALLAAFDRWRPAEGSEDGNPEEPAASPWEGQSAALVFSPRALAALELWEGDDPREIGRRASWANLPILDVWTELAGELGLEERDPVELHARVLAERLVCPGGGEYVLGPAGVRSTVFGSPLAPRLAPPLPPALAGVKEVRLGLTYEPAYDGLKVRGVLLRD